MKRGAWLIAALAGCLLAAITALGWLTWSTLAAELRTAQAENARLALWRIDTQVASLIAWEAGHPSAAFLAVSPQDPAFDMQSPPHAPPGPYVLARLRLGIAEPTTQPPANHPMSERRQQTLGEKLLKLVLADANPVGLTLLAERGELPPLPAPLASTTEELEFQNRANLVGGNLAIAQANVAQQSVDRALLTPPLDVLRPYWIDGQLFLARRSALGRAGSAIEAVWIDWPALSDHLLSSIRDLVPGATFLPIDPRQSPENPGRLSTLPLALALPKPAWGTVAGWTPTRLGLLATWLSLAIVAAAITVLVLGIIRLSERRAAFVSAVTHELRTPLTTFRLYAEMLAEGMVADELTRRAYLETLHREAQRLTRLVENVLSYARLERGACPAPTESLSVEALLSRVRERLDERARQSGFTLTILAADETWAASAAVDAIAVEQILFNLVDNACKYADAAENRQLQLAIKADRRSVLFSLRDHGPGVAASERRRLFQPFQKSAREAAESRPGIGLGLALSRQLARRMGGDLQHDPHEIGGASFSLTLPRIVENPTP